MDGKDMCLPLSLLHVLIGGIFVLNLMMIFFKMY